MNTDSHCSYIAELINFMIDKSGENQRVSVSTLMNQFEKKRGSFNESRELVEHRISEAVKSLLKRCPDIIRRAIWMTGYNTETGKFEYSSSARALGEGTSRSQEIPSRPGQAPPTQSKSKLEAINTSNPVKSQQNGSCSNGVGPSTSAAVPEVPQSSGAPKLGSRLPRRPVREDTDARTTATVNRTPNVMISPIRTGTAPVPASMSSPSPSDNRQNGNSLNGLPDVSVASQSSESPIIRSGLPVEAVSTAKKPAGSSTPASRTEQRVPATVNGSPLIPTFPNPTGRNETAPGAAEPAVNKKRGLNLEASSPQKEKMIRAWRPSGYQLPPAAVYGTPNLARINRTLPVSCQPNGSSQNGEGASGTSSKSSEPTTSSSSHASTSKSNGVNEAPRSVEPVVYNFGNYQQQWDGIEKQKPSVSRQEAMKSSPILSNEESRTVSEDSPLVVDSGDIAAAQNSASSFNPEPEPEQDLPRLLLLQTDNIETNSADSSDSPMDQADDARGSEIRNIPISSRKRQNADSSPAFIVPNLPPKKSNPLKRPADEESGDRNSSLPSRGAGKRKVIKPREFTPYEDRKGKYETGERSMEGMLDKLREPSVLISRASSPDSQAPVQPVSGPPPAKKGPPIVTAPIPPAPQEEQREPSEDSCMPSSRSVTLSTAEDLFPHNFTMSRVVVAATDGALGKTPADKRRGRQPKSAQVDVSPRYPVLADDPRNRSSTLTTESIASHQVANPILPNEESGPSPLLIDSDDIYPSLNPAHSSNPEPVPEPDLPSNSTGISDSSDKQEQPAGDEQESETQSIPGPSSPPTFAVPTVPPNKSNPLKQPAEKDSKDTNSTKLTEPSALTSHGLEPVLGPPPGKKGTVRPPPIIIAHPTSPEPQEEHSESSEDISMPLSSSVAPATARNRALEKARAAKVAKKEKIGNKKLGRKPKVDPAPPAEAAPENPTLVKDLLNRPSTSTAESIVSHQGANPILPIEESRPCPLLIDSDDIAPTLNPGHSSNQEPVPEPELPRTSSPSVETSPAGSSDSILEQEESAIEVPGSAAQNIPSSSRKRKNEYPSPTVALPKLPKPSTSTSHGLSPNSQLPAATDGALGKTPADKRRGRQSTIAQVDVSPRNSVLADDTLNRPSTSTAESIVSLQEAKKPSPILPNEKSRPSPLLIDSDDIAPTLNPGHSSNQEPVPEPELPRTSSPSVETSPAGSSDSILEQEESAIEVPGSAAQNIPSSSRKRKNEYPSPTVALPKLPKPSTSTSHGLSPNSQLPAATDGALGKTPADKRRGRQSTIAQVDVSPRNSVLADDTLNRPSTSTAESIVSLQEAKKPSPILPNEKSRPSPLLIDSDDIAPTLNPGHSSNQEPVPEPELPRTSSPSVETSPAGSSDSILEQEESAVEVPGSEAQKIPSSSRKRQNADSSPAFVVPNLLPKKSNPLKRPAEGSSRKRKNEKDPSPILAVLKLPEPSTSTSRVLSSDSQFPVGPAAPMCPAPQEEPREPSEDSCMPYSVTLATADNLFPQNLTMYGNLSRVVVAATDGALGKTPADKRRGRQPKIAQVDDPLDRPSTSSSHAEPIVRIDSHREERDLALSDIYKIFGEEEQESDNNETPKIETSKAPKAAKTSRRTSAPKDVSVDLVTFLQKMTQIVIQPIPVEVLAGLYWVQTPNVEVEGIQRDIEKILNSMFNLDIDASTKALILYMTQAPVPKRLFAQICKEEAITLQFDHERKIFQCQTKSIALTRNVNVELEEWDPTEMEEMMTFMLTEAQANGQLTLNDICKMYQQSVMNERKKRAAEDVRIKVISCVTCATPTTYNFINIAASLIINFKIPLMDEVKEVILSGGEFQLDDKGYLRFYKMGQFVAGQVNDMMTNPVIRMNLENLKGLMKAFHDGMVEANLEFLKDLMEEVNVRMEKLVGAETIKIMEVRQSLFDAVRMVRREATEESTDDNSICVAKVLRILLATANVLTGSLAKEVQVMVQKVVKDYEVHPEKIPQEKVLVALRAVMNLRNE